MTAGPVPLKVPIEQDQLNVRLLTEVSGSVTVTLTSIASARSAKFAGCFAREPCTRNAPMTGGAF